MKAETLKPDVASDRPTQWFQADAFNVLSTLRKRVSVVLSELGNFNRPADVQHSLALDKTLGRQIYKLASTAEPLGVANLVPSRTSIGRFLDRAKERGIRSSKLTDVWAAYEEFEKLVQTHAGDRGTFNSMISAATGVDDEWIAADLQHRRNAFRAMSHAMGLQAKARLQLVIVNELENRSANAIAMISGVIGLRVLRSRPEIRVEGIALRLLNGTESIACEPLGLGDALGGYLLDRYSSNPLPSLRIKEHRDNAGQWHEAMIDNPEIGNTGASTLLFGSVYPNLPMENGSLGLHVTTSRPSEMLLFDVLVSPGLLGGAVPTCVATLGQNEKFGAQVIPMDGRFEAELLGTGASALATPEVPRYADLLDDIAGHLKWNLEKFQAWRLRVEFPLYQSTVSMNWTQADVKVGAPFV